MKKYGGKLIFEGKDEYGPVEVVDRPGVRALHFGSPTEQSSMFLERPFALEMEYIQIMAVALLFRPDAKKILALGMGGGSLPKFIWKALPASEVTVVELSPLVLEVAHRFFEVPQDSRFKTVSGEALQFLQATQETYDLLFVDLYDGQGIAPVVAEPDFFEACDRRLKPGGLLIWNLWRSSAKDLVERSMRNLAASFGRNLLILPNQESGNFVVFVFKAPIQAYTKGQIEANAKQFADLLDFSKVLEMVNWFKGYGYLFQDWE